MFCSHHPAGGIGWLMTRAALRCAPQILDMTSLYLNNCVLGVSLFNFGARPEMMGGRKKNSPALETLNARSAGRAHHTAAPRRILRPPCVQVSLPT